MKKVLVTRRLLKSNEDRLKNLYEVNLNSNDELYSQKKLLELSEEKTEYFLLLTDKLDEDTINKLPKSVKDPIKFCSWFWKYRSRSSKKKKYCSY